MAPWWRWYAVLRRRTPWSREGRQMVVYTVAEIAQMLSVYQEVTKVKDVIPGATVEQARRPEDPLNGIRDGVSLDDDLDDVLQFGV